MYYCITLLPILIYAIIAFQDFKDRAVSWVFFPAIIIANICCSIWRFEVAPASLLRMAGINLALVGIQFLILQCYFSFRYKTTDLIIDRFIGLGDLLLYLALIFTFSPLNLFTFHVVSLALCLLLAAIFVVFRNKFALQSVPLAGIQSVLLLLLTIQAMLRPSFNFFDEQWVLNYTAYVR
ncbi:hypothetical protein [Chitinophaga flava]|uniref:Prepilin type IV endopeptidase peptidase domain-containing protein n=1 Tax=Chitinophaga flava TaxID=2259036 RepID=A0A365XZB8_9BACT|nr:hypothetical protein [Chitinophaga flava]RBL91719.1 hypothetical protein DF182_03685 [Chitinophaga flava]